MRGSRTSVIGAAVLLGIAGAITSMSGTLVLGDSITVDLRLGPDGISSGGVLIT